MKLFFNRRKTYFTAARIKTTLESAAVGFVLLTCLAGCSQMGMRGSFGGPASKDLTIDLFAARGFLGGSDYERYVVTEDVLWRECGQIQSSKQAAAKQSKDQPALDGDKVFKRDPNLQIQERRVEVLSSSQRGKLDSLAAEFIQALDSAAGKQPPPGSVFSLSEPGLFELAVRRDETKERLVTSVDAVSDGSAQSLSEAKELYSAIRGIGPMICGSNSFYGVYRKE